MRIYTVVTKSHLPLFHDIFFPSLHDSFELIVKKYDVNGPGYFCDDSYMKTLQYRVPDVLKSIDDNWTKVIAWSDVDILFNFLTADEVMKDFLAGGQSLVFSHLGFFARQVCFGFFAMRCDSIALTFWKKVYERISEKPQQYDQLAGHDIISEENYPHALFPDTYYGSCMQHPQPLDLKLYHATCVEGVENKLSALRGVREKILRGA